MTNSAISIDGYYPIYEKEREEGLNKVLSILSERKEKIFRLKFFEGKKYKEIGIECNVSGSRVGQLYQQVLNHLFRNISILEQYGFEKLKSAADRRKKHLEKEWKKERIERQKIRKEEFEDEKKWKWKQYRERVLFKAKRRAEWENQRKTEIERATLLGETIMIPNHPFPPACVELVEYIDGKQSYLTIQGNIKISRDRNRDCYDRWLNYLIRKKECWNEFS